MFPPPRRKNQLRRWRVLSVTKTDEKQMVRWSRNQTTKQMGIVTKTDRQGPSRKQTKRHGGCCENTRKQTEIATTPDETNEKSPGKRTKQTRNNHDNRTKTDGNHHDNRTKTDGNHHDNRTKTDGNHHDNRTKTDGRSLPIKALRRKAM